MKITRRQLRKIIKEELSRTLLREDDEERERFDPAVHGSAAGALPRAFLQVGTKQISDDQKESIKQFAQDHPVLVRRFAEAGTLGALGAFLGYQASESLRSQARSTMRSSNPVGRGDTSNPIRTNPHTPLGSYDEEHEVVQGGDNWVDSWGDWMADEKEAWSRKSDNEKEAYIYEYMGLTEMEAAMAANPQMTALTAGLVSAALGVATDVIITKAAQAVKRRRERRS